MRIVRIPLEVELYLECHDSNPVVQDEFTLDADHIVDMIERRGELDTTKIITGSFTEAFAEDLERQTPTFSVLQSPDGRVTSVRKERVVGFTTFAPAVKTVLAALAAAIDEDDDDDD